MRVNRSVLRLWRACLERLKLVGIWMRNNANFLKHLLDESSFVSPIWLAWLLHRPYICVEIQQLNSGGILDWTRGPTYSCRCQTSRQLWHIWINIGNVFSSSLTVQATVFLGKWNILAGHPHKMITLFLLIWQFYEITGSSGCLIWDLQ